MARLYANENFPLPVVRALRQLGHDVLTIQETGRANQEYPDEAVQAAAVADRRIILTMNRKHFIRLHQSNPRHHGIVICTADADFVGQAQRIHEALSGSQSLAGQLVRVNRPRSSAH
jgi:predicted nuclease of predicted toxin-antitoxin system